MTAKHVFHKILGLRNYTEISKDLFFFVKTVKLNTKTVHNRQ